LGVDRCPAPNANCGPSRATVVTGKYSHANGFYNSTNSRFDGSQVTFPKLLQKAGYQTAIVGKWHLVSDPTGFDYWQILPGQGRYYNPPMIDNGKRVEHPGYVTDVITDLSLDWLRKRDEQKAEWDKYYKPRNEKFQAAKPTGQDLVHWRYNRYMHDYLGCIKAVDESVGRLLDYLDKEGLADNTVVVYASDQGFYLGEHG